MYEIWVDNEDPTRHLVVKAGAAKPTFFDEKIWSRLGDVKALSPWLSQEVEACGFTTVTRLDVSFDAEREFGWPEAVSRRTATARKPRCRTCAA